MFVHYTVERRLGLQPGEKKHMVAGPYTEDEAIIERQKIAGYGGVVEAHVSESHERAPT